jgi:hypothetical protein
MFLAAVTHAASDNSTYVAFGLPVICLIIILGLFWWGGPGKDSGGFRIALIVGLLVGMIIMTDAKIGPPLLDKIGTVSHGLLGIYDKVK